MNDYTWFRLCVRLLGLIFLVVWLPELLQIIIQTLYVLFNTNSLESFAVYAVGTVISRIALVVLAVYLLLGGNGFVRWCLRDIRDICGGCGYTLKDLMSNVCPECGTVHNPQAFADALPPPPQTAPTPPAPNP